MAKAKSISAANLQSFARAAAKAATTGVPGKIIVRGQTMGYVPDPPDLGIERNLELATRIAGGVGANARAAGISGVKPSPAVIIKPNVIICGFIVPELGIPVR